MSVKNKKNNSTVKKTVSEADKQYITEIVNETIKTLQQGNNIKRGISYFQKTEKLLYSYHDLKESIRQKEDAIQYLDKYGMPTKSKSVVFYSTVGSNTESDAYMELKDGYNKAKGLTEWLVKKVDDALDTIKADKYYFIIEEKYLKTTKSEELSIWSEQIRENECNVGNSERTIQRNKKRLIQKIAITLFGAGALEDIYTDII